MELQEQKANCAVSENFALLKERISNVMKINEVPGDMLVTLTRNHGENEVIQVEFECDDVEEEDDNNEAAVDEENEEEAERHESDDSSEEDTLPQVAFTAAITRGDTSMHFECLAGEGLIVEKVTVLSANEDDRSETAYSGPYFDELEPSMQSAFMSYLDERYINDDLALFIAEYAEVKEQQEYVTFLEKATKFIK